MKKMLPSLLFSLVTVSLISACSDPFSTEPDSKPEPTQSSSLSRPKRVILITVDTLRADRLQCYGYRSIETPYIDGLAADGVLFQQAIAQVPLTLPSHCSILTGTYPYATGVRDQAGFRLKPEQETLAEIFERAGYDTGAFIGASVLNGNTGLSQGFDLYWDLKSRGESERRGDRVMGEALTWIKGRGQRRLFAWIHLFDPHAPYTPPEPHKSGYPGRPYDGEVAYVDELMGRLIEALKQNQLYEDSLIVFTSDHGESLGEHGEPSHGLFLYDVTLRIPLILKVPGSRWKSTIIPQQVRGIDIAPTILQLVSLKAKSRMQGRGLRNLIAGKWNQPELVAHSETYYPYYHFQWSPLFSLRTTKFKYIDAPRPELFDLEADPEEKRNIVQENGSMAASLEGRLEREYHRFSSRDGQGQAPEPEAIDPERMERLRSLGYVGFSAGGTGRPALEGLPDPKDKIDLYGLLMGAFDDSEQGRFLESTRKLKGVLRQDDGLVDAHLYLGLNLVEAADYQNASDSFKRVLELDQQNVLATFNLALCYANLGKLVAAFEGLNRTLELDPEDTPARVALGRVYQLQGKTDDAIAEFQSALGRNPGFAEAHLFLSQAYEAKGWKDKAQAERLQAERLGSPGAR